MTATIGLWGLLLSAARVNVFAPSPEAAADTRRRFGPWLKVGVLPNGVPDPGPPLALPDTLTLIFVGRLEAHKEPGTLLEAARLAIGSGTRFTVDIVGDGPLRADLEKQATESGLAEVVNFHGWLSDPNPVLDSGSVLVVTSRHEGASLVVLEAGARGRGIVARAGLEGLSEWHDAVIHVPTDAGPEDFAKVFEDLSHAPSSVAALGAAARATYANAFTLNLAARVTAQAYSAMVSP